MFSKKTYAYGAFIVISASFTFQIYKFFEIIFGEEILKLFFFGLFTIIAIFIIVHGIKINPDMIQISFIMLSLLLSLILIISLPILAEKTHILSYGLLSYLAIKDLAGTKLSTFKSILLALIFALFVNILDELFQAILPYRVGAMHDVIVNVFCTIIGILLFFGFNRKKLSNNFK